MYNDDLFKQLHNLYSLDCNKGYIDKFFSVDNQFMRQLGVLSMTSAKQELKILNVITKNSLVNRGETAKRGVSADNKSVLDICKLTPLVGSGIFKNVQEEVAYYRWHSLPIDKQGVSQDFWLQKSQLLFVDYLLSSCVCYVEVFDTGVKVDKFLATRNRYLAGNLADIDNKNSQKWCNFLSPLQADYTNNSLRMLKLTRTKDKFKVTQPRNSVDFNKYVKVTPLFFMTNFIEGISDYLQTDIIKIKYVKDNLQEREMYTTLSTPILLKYYPQEFVQLMYSNCANNLSRGYIQMPELGVSKYDRSGVRALNVSRITSIERVDSFDSSYINVDFDNILPTFKNTVENMNDMQTLQFLYMQILQSVPSQGTSIMSLQNAITAYVDSQYAIGTTTYLRVLHTFMLNFSQIFNGYTGQRVAFTGFDNTANSFNLGC